MTTIAEFLAAEHRGCDEVFAAAEDAANEGDLSRCRADFQEFCKVMEQHFRREEEVLDVYKRQPWRPSSARRPTSPAPAPAPG